MVDHQSSSSQRQQHHQSQSQHHPPHFQVQHRHYSHQDIHGPLSAGVVEGGHRAFPSFHSSPFHHPLHSSSSSSHPSFSNAAIPPPSSSSGAKSSLSVSDILERYQDANKEFIMSVLNAKAKEDERRAEEERYKTEQVKLQSKKLELELATERRRESPPAPRPYPAHHSEPSSTGHYPSSSYYGSGSGSGSSYQPFSSSDGPRSHPSGNSSKPVHHEHNVHTPQETQDHTQSSHQGSKHAHTDQHAMQPSPQSRPPFLKINTAVRHYHPQPHSSQRLPPSPHSTLPPLPSTNPLPKSSSRHYGLPSLATSAQSSPAAAIDYQSHIPPPLTPKEEHVSPTSALSPTTPLNSKRKSVNHDAVMDAVRAKVMRNAAGQSQQKRAAVEAEREVGPQSSRRKTHHGALSPDTSRRPVETNQITSPGTESRQEERRDGRTDNNSNNNSGNNGNNGNNGGLSSLREEESSPRSPSSGNTENGHGSNRSRSSSPLPPGKLRRQMSKTSQHAQSTVVKHEVEEESRETAHETEQRRPDRSADSGGNVPF
ncbi:hypothetical protein BGZ68_005406 [Mortierella alpina]|nr:hypothetical protein BGZ68_005406 [Mortierella alpina]